MNARAALFDLYGDHLRPRGGVAPISSVIQLLAPLGIAAPAVRTAVSRMARQGWLTRVPGAEGTAYGLTDRAQRRLDEAAERIYGRVAHPAWDGRWSMLVVAHTSNRSRRERLQRGLTYLGYRPLDGSAWVAPRRSVEVEAVIAAEGLRYDEFAAEFAGQDDALVDRLYDLGGLAAAYRAWLADARGAGRGGRGDTRRPGRVRRPQPARARVAQVPLPRPRAARRPAAGGLAGRRGRGVLHP